MKIKLNLGKKQMFFIILLIFISGISGVIAVVPNPGHGWTQIECDNSLCITSGKVGIGTAVPSAKLHVVGNNGIKVTSSTESSTYINIDPTGLVPRSSTISGSGDIFLQVAPANSVFLSNNDPFNFHKFEFSGASGNVEMDGGLFANSVVASSVLYSGGTAEGNKVCRKDGTNCPPAVNPQLSCTTRSGGRASGPKSVSCQSGETMTGGGCEVFAIIGQSALTQHSYPRLPNTWTCDYGGYESKPYAICCRIA